MQAGRRASRAPAGLSEQSWAGPSFWNWRPGPALWEARQSPPDARVRSEHCLPRNEFCPSGTDYWDTSLRFLNRPSKAKSNALDGLFWPWFSSLHSSNVHGKIYKRAPSLTQIVSPNFRNSNLFWRNMIRFGLEPMWSLVTISYMLQNIILLQLANRGVSRCHLFLIWYMTLLGMEIPWLQNTVLVIEVGTSAVSRGCLSCFFRVLVSVSKPLSH